MLKPEPEPEVQFGFKLGSQGSQTGPQPVYSHQSPIQSLHIFAGRGKAASICQAAQNYLGPRHVLMDVRHMQIVLIQQPWMLAEDHHEKMDGQWVIWEVLGSDRQDR